ncbi:hypothetical protein KKC13_06765 [bacterium]|nr:hypothetical protein [bacterium]MBU1958611.1 hypothetical protein [bacterium]
MKVLVVLALFAAIGLIFLFYKREKNIQKLLFSLTLLSVIIAYAVVGNVMRSIMPLFLAHIMALILAYGGLIYYILRARTQWILWLLPALTLLFYVLLAWVGNEHIIRFS